MVLTHRVVLGGSVMLSLPDGTCFCQADARPCEVGSWMDNQIRRRPRIAVDAWPMATKGKGRTSLGTPSPFVVADREPVR